MTGDANASGTFDGTENLELDVTVSNAENAKKVNSIQFRSAEKGLEYSLNGIDWNSVGGGGEITAADGNKYAPVMGDTFDVNNMMKVFSPSVKVMNGWSRIVYYSQKYTTLIILPEGVYSVEGSCVVRRDPKTLEILASSSPSDLSPPHNQIAHYGETIYFMYNNYIVGLNMFTLEETMRSGNINISYSYRGGFCARSYGVVFYNGSNSVVRYSLDLSSSLGSITSLGGWFQPLEDFLVTITSRVWNTGTTVSATWGSFTKTIQVEKDLGTQGAGNYYSEPRLIGANKKGVVLSHLVIYKDSNNVEQSRHTQVAFYPWDSGSRYAAAYIVATPDYGISHEDFIAFAGYGGKNDPVSLKYDSYSFLGAFSSIPTYPQVKMLYNLNTTDSKMVSYDLNRPKIPQLSQISENKCYFQLNDNGTTTICSCEGLSTDGAALMEPLSIPFTPICITNNTLYGHCNQTSALNYNGDSYLCAIPMTQKITSYTKQEG